MRISEGRRDVEERGVGSQRSNAGINVLLKILYQQTISNKRIQRLHDQLPSDTKDRDQRALQGLARVLFASNEFMFVD